MATTAGELGENELRLRPWAGAADWALTAAVRLWFAVLLAGQLFFVAHIVSFYGRTLLAGEFNRWNKVLQVGFVPGDHLGNRMLGLHLAMAALITFAGLLQLTPQIRARFPTFHRWVGRSYVVFAVLASTSALYLSLIRGGVAGDSFQHAATDLDAILILIFAALALRFALARNFVVHRRWAVRLFLAVSGVWFFRVGLFFWIFINRGPVGFDPDKFVGPALIAVGFMSYLLPLAVFELYWRVQQRGAAVTRIAVAATLVVLTLGMAVGVFAHAMFMLSSGAAF